MDLAPPWRLLMVAPYALMALDTLHCVLAVSGLAGTLSQPKWLSPSWVRIFYALMGYWWMSKTVA